MREHKFDVTLIEYVATLAHTQKHEKMEGMPIACAQKDNPMEEPTKIVGSGREASSGGI